MDPSEIPQINEDRSPTRIAYVYMHTSPSGHSYIGQTVRTMENRWRQHVAAARDYENSCPAIENAIRLYGSDSFTHEILITTTENLVDYYEHKFIADYDTLVPNGYNIHPGGVGHSCTDEMKQRMRDVSQLKVERKEWPYDRHPRVKYLNYFRLEDSNPPIEGYIVCKHPNGTYKKFVSGKLSIDEKYHRAVEYKMFLDNHDGPYEGHYGNKERLPTHMYRINGIGFKVTYPGSPTKRFCKKNQEGENRFKAFEYLTSIVPEDDFERVFKCGVYM